MSDQKIPKHVLRPDLNRPAAAGGERSGDRAAMDRVTRDLVSGGMPPARAREEARQSMIRVDRERRGDR